eukprot:518746-Rhodomonas_salina.1
MHPYAMSGTDLGLAATRLDGSYGSCTLLLRYPPCIGHTAYGIPYQRVERAVVTITLRVSWSGIHTRRHKR